MPKRSSLEENAARIKRAQEAMSRQDQAAQERQEAARRDKPKLLLKKILPREADIRPLREKHVLALAESIQLLGLIQPIVVDCQGRLLAGAHRLAAIQRLKVTEPEVYNQHFPSNQIPVRMMDFEVGSDSERAFQVELAENEKRVNYTRQEIQQLADQLKALNYRSIEGRPKLGEKALGPALAVAVGVSTQYIRRILSNESSEASEERSKPQSAEKCFKKIESFLEGISKEFALLEGLSESQQSLIQEISQLFEKARVALCEAGLKG